MLGQYVFLLRILVRFTLREVTRASWWWATQTFKLENVLSSVSVVRWIWWSSLSLSMFFLSVPCGLSLLHICDHSGSDGKPLFLSWNCLCPWHWHWIWSTYAPGNAELLPSKYLHSWPIIPRSVSDLVTFSLLFIHSSIWFSSSWQETQYWLVEVGWATSALAWGLQTKSLGVVAAVLLLPGPS